MAAKKTSKATEKKTAARKSEPKPVKKYDSIGALFKAKGGNTLPRGLKFKVDGHNSSITFFTKDGYVAAFGLVQWVEWTATKRSGFTLAK